MNANKQLLISLMQEMNGNYGRLEAKIKKHDLLFTDIHTNWEFAFSPKNFFELCYYYLHGVSPICNKGNRKTFEYFSTGYVSCGRRCECAIERYHESMIKHYGVKCPFHSKEICDKRDTTWANKYGTTNLYEIGKDKRRSTNLALYGVEHTLQSPEIRKKVIDTVQTKYGVDNIFSIPAIQQQIQQNWKDINPNGQRTYVRTKQDGIAASLKFSEQNFNDPDGVLQDPDKLTIALQNKSRMELSKQLGCSTALIDARIAKFELPEFQTVFIFIYI